MLVAKKRNNSFLKSKIILIIAIVALVFFIVGLTKEIMNRRSINEQINGLNNQIKELQSQNNQISDLINTWQDGSHLEKEARLRLGLQKPGEKAVIISQSESKTSSSGQQLVDSGGVVNNFSIADNNSVANPIKWIHYFFK